MSQKASSLVEEKSAEIVFGGLGEFVVERSQIQTECWLGRVWVKIVLEMVGRLLSSRRKAGGGCAWACFKGLCSRWGFSNLA